jgi:hypothetical protein
VLVQGGAGNDFLALACENPTTWPAARATVDGGSGFDVAVVSWGVRALNCERVFVIER